MKFHTTLQLANNLMSTAITLSIKLIKILTKCENNIFQDCSQFN